MTALCLVAAGISLRIVTAAFTLGWTHTIEHTSWEEDWTIAPDGLVLTEARIEGSGAGMEPPPEARLVAGRFMWRPPRVAIPALVLRRAEQAGDWQLCMTSSGCESVGARLGAQRSADPVTLAPCP